MKAGDRIRKRRVAAGLTLEQLGKLTGISFSYVSQIERGLKMPSIGLLIRMAAALGMNARRLLEDSGCLTPAECRALWGDR